MNIRNAATARVAEIEAPLAAKDRELGESRARYEELRHYSSTDDHSPPTLLVSAAATLPRAAQPTQLSEN
jgi:hypothetical protein